MVIDRDSGGRCGRRWAVAATVLGWHAVAAASFLAFAFSLSDDASPTCSGFCFSPRGGVAIIGMVLGGPALLVSLLVLRCCDPLGHQTR